LRAQFSSMMDLEVRLWDIVSEARNSWPDIEVDPVTFVAWVGTRLQVDHEPHEALAAVRASDLYLACACAQGDTAALSAFERFVAEIDLALARMRVNRAQVEEVKQLVRQKLFVAPSADKRVKIADYSGRGDLRRWVRAIAVRTCLNQMRKGKREVLMKDDKVLAGVAHSDDDPELAYMKQKYRIEFREAFLAALNGLTDRQQNLLRYHHVDELNIDEIGAIYRVHRVTAYRWLEKAREALVTQTQKLLRAKLQVEAKEFDSILRMIRSQLHLSLVRHLGELDIEGDP
jgi:RNA polymerase sigma-70 factor (ECF subfamily)